MRALLDIILAIVLVTPAWSAPLKYAPPTWEFGTWAGARLDRAGKIDQGLEASLKDERILGGLVQPTGILGFDQAGVGAAIAGRAGGVLSYDWRPGHRHLSLTVFAVPLRF